MDSTSFVSETIRYQKMTSDQIFELLTLCQSNSEDLLQKTLDQCDWLPANSKESCLDWSASCREATKFIQDIVDNGFEQVEQAFVAPAIKETPAKRSQPKQAAAPPSKTARPKKTTSTPKTKAKAPAKKVTQKAVAATDEVPKPAPSKAKPSVQKSQESTPKREAAAPSKPISAAAGNVTAEVAPSSHAKPPAKSTRVSSNAADDGKTPTPPPTSPTSSS